MRLVFPLLLLFCQLAVAQPKSHVKASLTADREGIVKGETFMLGVHLTMSDHWHTYWEFPGFSGLPTKWTLEAVPGLEVGELQFPLPKKFVDDAGFITYGFDDEALLFAKAVYSGTEKSLTINAKIDWLECKDLCIPGSARSSLTLKVGKSVPANEKLFQKYTPQAPVAFNDQSPFTYETAYEFGEETWKGSLTLTPRGNAWSTKPEDFAFFPLASDVSELKTSEFTIKDGRYQFNLTYNAFEPAPKDLVLNGVVKVQTADGLQVTRLKLYPGPEGKASAPGGVTGSEPTPAVPAAASGAPDYTFWTIMLFAFLGGCILNLMPCVLPVLSLKVFSLLNEAGESSRRRIQFGWVYTIGIMASFLLLSLFFVSARAAGEELGIGFQFQSPAFVIGISVLIFAMGLSFLGVYDIQPPATGRLSSLTMKSGYTGAFFNGALMTILSTPCTAPMLGAAYGWALSQSTPVILLTFQVVAFGLASPYLFLCYFPAMLKFMPKPGSWMNTFKVSMGFLLMGTVVWLVKILGDLTGVSGIVGLMTLLIGIAAACWVYGQTFFTESRNLGLVVAVLLMVGGYDLGMNRLFDINNPKKDKEAYVESLRLSFSNDFEALEQLKTTSEKIAWVPYSPENLEYFRKQDRLIFLDFTASWCATCKVNERLFIDTKKVRTAFANTETVTMIVDYTDKSDEITEFIRSFDRAGVPLYVIYPGEGDPILLPEAVTRGIIIDALEEGLAQMGQKTAAR